MAAAAAQTVKQRRNCSPKSQFLILLLLFSAVPIAYLISLELSISTSSNVYYYHSNGYLREAAVWDSIHRRFIVSFFDNGIGQIVLQQDDEGGGVLQETVVVKDDDLTGYSSLGLTIDRPRNRLLVAIADVLNNRFSALAAYDLSNWNRLFLTTLSASGDEKSMADDVAVDPEGNAYVTDAKSSKIWKLNVNGELKSIIKSPLFTPKEWYKSLVALNGIVYHPDGYLLVIHTFSGNLYKIKLNQRTDQDQEQVQLVKVVSGSLILGDGIELLSPTKLVVAGNPSGRLVESNDDWETASVVSKFSGLVHRLATSAVVKDGKVYLSHMLGMGYPKKKHALVEAVFST